jgi:hypothetical protein
MEVTVFEKENALVVLRRNGPARAAAVFHFGDAPATLRLPDGPWKKILDSSDSRWGGPGGSAAERPDPRAGNVLPVRPKSFILLLFPGKETR